MGHEERFPPKRLSAGCGFTKETIAGMRRNGRDAPSPDLPVLTPERERFDPKQSLVAPAVNDFWKVPPVMISFYIMQPG
jgi:hypothetical protein